MKIKLWDQQHRKTTSQAQEVAHGHTELGRWNHQITEVSKTESSVHVFSSHRTTGDVACPVHLSPQLDSNIFSQPSSPGQDTSVRELNLSNSVDSIFRVKMKHINPFAFAADVLQIWWWWGGKVEAFRAEQSLAEIRAYKKKRGCEIYNMLGNVFSISALSYLVLKPSLSPVSAMLRTNERILMNG